MNLHSSKFGSMLKSKEAILAIGKHVQLAYYLIILSPTFFSALGCFLLRCDEQLGRSVNKTFLKVLCLMNAAYILFLHRSMVERDVDWKNWKMWHVCYNSNLHSLVHALGINQFFKWHAAPLPPRDPAVRNVADRLASFVAKHGRQIEHVTRQKNPGDTPFKYGCFYSLTIHILCNFVLVFL